MTLYAKDNILRVTLNDEKIVDMDLNRWTTPGKNPDGSPNKFERPFCEMTEKGYLGLQDHGGLIWFRNLEIKEL
jgi:hypothetical protein